jgi:CBS domain-containing protein
LIFRAWSGEHLVSSSFSQGVDTPETSDFQEITMLCSDIMRTDVECIAPEDSVQEAATRMRERSIGFLPVCESQRRVVGALTDRDIVVRLIAQGGSSSDSVSSVMSEFVVTCLPSTNVESALELMRRHHVWRLVCVDSSECVVGVLSLSDIATQAETFGASLLLEGIVDIKTAIAPN